MTFKIRINCLKKDNKKRDDSQALVHNTLYASCQTETKKRVGKKRENKCKSPRKNIGNHSFMFGLGKCYTMNQS